MPRGIARSTPGRLNGLEAHALAKRINQEHPGYRAVVFPIAQGIARVDVQTPNGTVIVRSEKDLSLLLEQKESVVITEQTQGADR